MARAKAASEANAEKSNRQLSMIWTATLYYAQGLPFSIVRQMSVVYFKEQGVALQNLGLVPLYGIPWTFKFLWSPLIDTLFTKRKWIIAMEILLAGLLAGVVALVSAHASVQAVAFLFLIIAFISATHDVAIDGFYLDALNKTDQAKYSGWRVASYRLAMLAGNGFLIKLSAKFGWPMAFATSAVLFIIMCLWHSRMLPRPEVKGMAHLKKDKSTEFKKIFEGFRTFLLLPRIIPAVIFIILFKLGDALLFGMSTPFLLDSGMTKDQLGTINGFFGTIAAILASIAGGWFISKYKLKKGLWLFGIIQNLAIPAYAYVAYVKGPVSMLGVVVIIEQIAAGLGTAAYSNFLMRQVNPDYKATHYAIVTGLMSLTLMLGGVLSGFGASHYGYATFFLLAFVASIPGLVMIPFIANRPECR